VNMVTLPAPVELLLLFRAGMGSDGYTQVDAGAAIVPVVGPLVFGVGSISPNSTTKTVPK